MSELSLFCAIVCPMPFTLRKKCVIQLSSLRLRATVKLMCRMFHFLSENPVVSFLSGNPA